MRHAIFVPLLLVAALIAWRVGTLVAGGRALHERERGALERMKQIVLAEEERRLHPPRGANGQIYGYLSELAADGALTGFEPVADLRLDLFRADGYLFHVSLLNRLNHPFRLPPADRAAEPRFGVRFEAWAWPEDPEDTQLVLFFASTGGTLLQGENGGYAGIGDFPGDAFAGEGPLQQHERDGAKDTRWLEVFQLDRP